MVTNQENKQQSEINPKPVRNIKLMGIVSLSDWILFVAGLVVVFVVILASGLQGSLWATFGKIIIACVIAVPWAAFCFIQDNNRGKLRTRIYRFIRFSFSRRVINKSQLHGIYSIKEIDDNIIFFKNSTDQGYTGIYRISGFNTDLLTESQLQECIQGMINSFSLKMRYKIISCDIAYKLPLKNFANLKNHPGINYAKNKYIERINSINESTTDLERAYFIVLESPKKEVIFDNYRQIEMAFASAKLFTRKANENEMSNVINRFWFNSVNMFDPRHINVDHIEFSPDMYRITKTDGSHQYQAICSFVALPEVVGLHWMNSLFNNPYFTLLADFSDVSPVDAVHKIEEMDVTTDNLVQSKWFKKKASDNERLKIEHIKQQVAQLNQQLATGSVNLKQVCFYMIFSADKKSQLKNIIKEYKENLNVTGGQWMFYDCKYLQLDGLISTRIHDIPSLQYVQSKNKGGNIKKIGGLASNIITSGTTVQVSSSNPNKLSIVQQIDHYILNTSLGLGYPFFEKSVVDDQEAWFKGWDTSDGSTIVEGQEQGAIPFLQNYWKVNELYNSFNRFYQGRNGSGKSYTANIDFVEDVLDDKFVISIDPKPERVLLTNNLGGANIYIGNSDKGSTCINIFDVLVVPHTSESGASDPLMSQYESNLLSIGTLLSLNEDNPADKLLLSCFNDIQKYVYEDIHKFKFNTDFSKVPRNKMPIMKEFYFEGLKRANKQKNVTVKEALEKLCMLLKEHAIGISAPLFNSFTNIDWTKSTLWNFVVKEIALNYNNKNILACWVNNIIRVSSSFMIAGKHVVLYIDELHLIHNIPGVLQRLDEFARIDRSFKAALCLINQNFNSVRSQADLKKKEYYESIFTMSQYNLFFTTGDEDVDFLVEMLANSGQPLSPAERQYMTRAGRGKALLLMTAFDRFRVQFDISYWKDLWEKDITQYWADDSVDTTSQNNVENTSNDVKLQTQNQQPITPSKTPNKPTLPKLHKNKSHAKVSKTIKHKTAAKKTVVIKNISKSKSTPKKVKKHNKKLK